MKAKVSNIKIETMDYDLSKIKLDKNIIEIGQKMLPNPREKITFDLHANVGIANAIRRTILCEMKTKCIHIDFADISTNEEYIQFTDLCNRISLIPINQSIPVGTEFYLNSCNEFTPFNDNDGFEFKYIKSAEIKPIEELNIKPFDGGFRIARLHAGKYLKIGKMTVIEGIGLETQPKFSLTNRFSYKTLDYLDIFKLNERGNENLIRVKRDELQEVIKKHKIKDIDLYEESKKILIIPNESNMNGWERNEHTKSKKFKHILIGVDLLNYENQHCRASEFRLSFETFGNIGSSDLIKATCDNLIERLQYVNDNHTKHSVGADTIYEIMGETYTIGYLLTNAIFELDPNVSNLNFKLVHPLNRQFSLIVNHSQADKLFFDAIKKCITQFEIIKSYF